jgi:hypothetical protein
MKCRQFFVGWGFPHSFDKVEHIAIDPQGKSLTLLSVATLCAFPPRIRWHIEIMKEEIDIVIRSDSGKFLTMSSFGKTKIKDCRNTATDARNGHSCDHGLAPIDPLHSPVKFDRVGAVFPKLRDHPFIHGIIDAADISRQAFGKSAFAGTC